MLWFFFPFIKKTAHVGGMVLLKDRDDVEGSWVITGVEWGHTFSTSNRRNSFAKQIFATVFQLTFMVFHLK